MKGYNTSWDDTKKNLSHVKREGSQDRLQKIHQREKIFGFNPSEDNPDVDKDRMRCIQLGEINDNLKRVYGILSQYNNYMEISSSELQKWNEDFNNIMKGKSRKKSIRKPGYFIIIIENVERELDQMNISNSDDMHVKNLFQEVKEQLKKTKAKVHQSSITLGNLYELSDKITKQQACLKKGEQLPEIIQDKSMIRENEGMTKHLVNRSLEEFYRFFVERLDQENIEKQDIMSHEAGDMQDARDFIEERVKLGLVEGEVDDYFFVQPQPRTPSSEYTGGMTLYESYVNLKTGSMIVRFVYGKQDRDWRYENISESELEDTSENLHRKFLKLFRMSDLEGEIYYRAAKAYEKLTGNNASNTKEIFVSKVEEEATLDVLSIYVKPANKETFSKEYEGEKLCTTVGTPIGEIFSFMLAQNPEKVGDGEITKAEVAMSSSSEYIEYMKLYISEKREVE
jgi:hypothetical protein